MTTAVLAALMLLTQQDPHGRGLAVSARNETVRTLGEAVHDPRALAAMLAAARPALKLVLYDPHQLLPNDFQAVTAEIERIFDAIEVTVSVRRALADESPRLDTWELRVVLMPSEPTAWGLEEDVIGLVVGSQNPRDAAYVFVPRVLSILGFRNGDPRSLKPKNSWAYARALARVTAHEVVHAVAPEHPHANGGLMNDRQGRWSLIGDELFLDRDCAQAFLNALENIRNP